MNSTGVAHSTPFRSAKIALRASASAASTGAEAVGEGGVELAREGDRGAVGDLELHRDDGGDLAVDEARRHSGKRVADRAAGALASVQDGEPKGRLIGQDRAELHSADEAAAPAPVLEHEHPVVARPVIAAVTDVVEDVVVVAARELYDATGELCDLAQKLCALNNYFEDWPTDAEAASATDDDFVDEDD